MNWCLKLTNAFRSKMGDLIDEKNFGEITTIRVCQTFHCQKVMLHDM